MSLGTGIVLFVIGAILAFALNVQVSMAAVSNATVKARYVAERDRVMWMLVGCWTRWGNDSSAG